MVLYEVERGGVDDLVHLGFYGFGYLRYRVPAYGGDDAAEEVQILVSLRVPDLDPLAAHQLHGSLVVERHPVGESSLVTLCQLVGIHARVGFMLRGTKLRSMNLPEP